MPVRLRVERGLGSFADLGEARLRARLLRRAEAMLALLQLEKAELSLVLSGDAQVRELNKVYRGKDRPTDVLAFPMREGDFGRFHAALPSRLLGDVIVSVPTAARQARAARHPLLGEITMLVAHGLLHLLGWDHETASKDRKMRAETTRLVAAADSSDSPGAPRPARSPARKSTAPSPRALGAYGTRKQKPHKRPT